MNSDTRCPYCDGSIPEGCACPKCGRTVDDTNRPLPREAQLFNRRYRLEHALGSGGFGITYRAWDDKRKEIVALKELFPASCALRREGARALAILPEKADYFHYAQHQFIQEAMILRMLKNEPEILKVYHCFEENRTVYYSMEYVAGENLAVRLKKKRPMTWAELARPVSDTLAALRALHRAGLLHRDISPDNILCLPDGSARLIDFGSARNYEKVDHFTTVFKAPLAPPEMFDKRGNQGPWTDIYLLSATIFYLLSGGTMPEHVYKRLTTLHLRGYDPYVPLSRSSPAAPDCVLAAVDKGLSLRAEDRFASADAFAAALFPQFRPAAAKKTADACVICIRGQFKGRSFPLGSGERIALGRGAPNAIAYPGQSPRISRKQCCFYVSAQGQAFVMDTQSSYGTFLDGKKLPPWVWVPLRRGVPLRVGDEEYMLRE